MKKWLYIVIGGIVLMGAAILFLSTDIHKSSSAKNGSQGPMKAYALPLPGRINFAGEAVPMDLFWVRESLDRELLTNTYWHSSTLLSLKRSFRYFPQIEPFLARHKVPMDFKYLAVIESNFSHVVSPAGASGYWQFMKETGLEYGLEINDEVDERYNVEKSTEAACKYLKAAYAKFGSWTLAAAAYNAGPDNISKPLATQGTTSFYETSLNPETSRYIFRILAMKEIMTYPKKYGFVVTNTDLYPNIPVQEIKVDTAIRDLSAFARSFGINYKILREFNPWIRKNTLSNKMRKTYTFSIPAKDDLYYSKLLQNASMFGKVKVDTI